MIVAAVALAVVVSACSNSTTTSGTGTAKPSATAAVGAGHPTVGTEPTSRASFRVSPGVEQVTVTQAAPKAKLTLVNNLNEKLVTLIADDHGQAVFSYVPDDYLTFATGTGDAPPTTKGRSLDRGDGYFIRDETGSTPADSERFSVLGRDDHPPTSLYEAQQLKGVPWAIIGGKPKDGAKAGDGMQYILTRDGTQLSAMVRFPDPAVYGNGPYPTVVEYSGYDPANPDSPQPGTSIATSLGFATVGVNLRGTGCSGGVFDVFNPAQQADGYDVIETVARQPWVKGNKVGMVGLSYSGITQLYVASTRPPSLAAITPLSVIEDPWKMSWPGGIYNAGFTKQWLEERDRQAKPNGQSWVEARIKSGDQICDANQKLRSQNIDFEKFARSLEFRPKDDDQRDLSLLVKDINVPLYLSGAWQDEQTGPRFATMLANFTGTDKKHFVLYNGHHPDGYAPSNLSRWLEFLQLYVAHQIPHLDPVVRAGATALFQDNFGVALTFDEDRFTDVTSYEAALKKWESDPVVRVKMEWGNGMPDVPGAPVARYEVRFDSWPPSSIQPWNLYFGANGTLSPSKPTDTAEARDEFQFDPDAGPLGYTRAGAMDFLKPNLDIDWRPTPDGKGLSYLTDALDRDVVIAGPSYADLWLSSDAEDADLEVVLSEVQADGTEVRIQNGLLRAGHRKVDASRSDQFLIQETFAEGDYQKLPAGEAVEVKVPIFPVMHALRKGSKLRVEVNTPGRDLPLWFFENSDFGKPDAWNHVSRSASHPSGVVLPVLPAGAVEVLPGYPPCPSLRGQPCRPYTPSTNAAG